uniref:Endochitinase 1 (Fragments) n=1 Tax=Capsicum chinense TaxID=80379 RepID=CHI1_CAPCH|nr:RecName: Full=Endochitinase 1 [Capsicum chinense]
NNFYSYNAFITAAKSFPGFGTTGDTAVRGPIQISYNYNYGPCGR